MKKLKQVNILATSSFICAGCGNKFLLFTDRIKRYAYKKQQAGASAYYCRYNCWVGDK